MEKTLTGLALKNTSRPVLLDTLDAKCVTSSMCGTSF